MAISIPYIGPMISFKRSVTANRCSALFAPLHHITPLVYRPGRSLNHICNAFPPLFWASASLVQLATAAYGLFDDYGVGNNFFERFDFFTVSFLTSPSHVSAQSIDQWSRAMIPRTAMSSM